MRQNRGASSRCAAVRLAVILGIGLAFGYPMAALGTDAGVHVLSTQKTASGLQVVLSVDPPALTPVRAKDSNVYTKVLVPGCGNDNALGRPALPIISHTVEIPWGAAPQVDAQAGNLADRTVDHWVYPQQPPVPKLPGPAGNPPFVIDTAYYEGKTAAGLQKAATGEGPQVIPFKKRGKQFVNILVRPFAYDPVKGVVQCPSEITLNVSWTLNPLPKAAGPRTGTITVVEVTLTDPSQLDALVKEGYDISSRKGDVVTIYATDAELAALKQKGLQLREIEPQPRPPAPGAEPGSKALGVKHTYATLTQDLQDFATTYPAVCRLSSLGQSIQGREIWAMKITDNPDVAEDEPEVRYLSSLHGDETTGMELCLYFIDLLLADYGTDPRITNLVNETEVWIVPMANPDGLEAHTRYNADGLDLNRSFPDGAEENIGNVLYGPAMGTAGRPLEVVRIMQWSAAHRFVVSANYHGGSLVVNYPYDNDGLGSVESPAPDDAFLQVMSRAYSSHNLPMWNSAVFSDGVTNGAAWYSITGGMQDWNYRYLGCNDVTIEVSEIKDLPASSLPQFWSDNQESMLSYVETAQEGVRGIVTDSGTGSPVSAAVTVVGISHLVFTDPALGDYHRQLLPGAYDLVFSAPNYQSKTISGVSVADGAATRIDVTLTPQQGPPPGIVVVSNATWATEAANYRAQKQTEGFDVYDVTITGSPGAETVRTSIRNVYNAHQPAYVVILGDTEIVPAFTDEYGYFSDLLYALMDPGETWANYLGKDLLVGRVSVHGASAVTDYVAKLAAFSAGVKHQDLTWISGGSDDIQNDIAEGTHNWVMANAIPPSYHNELFYRSNGSAPELTAHINAGTDGVVYSGHGAYDLWARYGYSIVSLQTLTNYLDAPIVLGHCCETGSFGYSTCFAEAWMQTTARGIVYVGGSGNTYWDEDDLLERQEFQAMADLPGLPIGDALAQGLEQVHTNYPSSAQYYFTIYTLFGDPTVSLFGKNLTIVTPQALPLAYVGEPYSATVSAVNGELPYAWSLTGGALPDGLAFDTDTQLVSGIPTAPAHAAFTIEVRDAASSTANREFQIDVVNRLVILTPEQLPMAVVDHAYARTLQTQGGTAPVTWRITDTAEFDESNPGAGWFGGGAPQGWHADDESWPLTLPWPFPFGDTDYTSVNVCSNGFLDFTSSDPEYSNSDAGLRSAVRIAALWDDLDTSTGSLDVYVTQAADYVVIRWQAVTLGFGTLVNVEAVLYRNGNIRFNYGQAHSGLTPTIGVSCGDGTHCIYSTYNSRTSIPANVSTLFTPRVVLPPGLTLSSAGLISGTTAVQGQYAFTARATDSGTPQQTVERQFSLGVGQFRFVQTPVGGWKEVGGQLELSVVVDGTYGNVTYQWIKDGHELLGATDPTYEVSALTLADEGWYICRVTDEAKAVYETEPVLVLVFPAHSLPGAGVSALALAALACAASGVRSIARRRREQPR